MKVQEIRIAKGDNAEDIKTWTDKIEQELETWDGETLHAQKTTGPHGSNVKRSMRIYAKRKWQRKNDMNYLKSMGKKISWKDKWRRYASRHKIHGVTTQSYRN